MIAILPPERAFKPPLRIPPRNGLIIGEGGREDSGVEVGDAARDMDRGEGDPDLGEEEPEVEEDIFIEDVC